MVAPEIVERLANQQRSKSHAAKLAIYYHLVQQENAVQWDLQFPCQHVETGQSLWEDVFGCGEFVAPD